MWLRLIAEFPEFKIECRDTYILFCKRYMVITTVAFVMGKADVNEVIHWGSLPDIWPETGCGGVRDGLPTTAILHNVPDVKNIDETMKEYISNKLECWRKLLMEYFDEGVHESDHEQSCKCCDNCQHSCTCFYCYHRWYHGFMHWFKL